MQEIKEEWRDVPNYEGLYQVSNLGRVRSMSHEVRTAKHGTGLRMTDGIILSPFKSSHGYLFVGLNKNNQNKKFSIHRLVAMAFIPNPNNYPCVNHKDEVKDNNVVSNLEWCDKSYNALYGSCQEKLRKYKNQPVKIYDKKTNKFVAEFESMKIAMEKTGVHTVTISQVCRGIRKSAGGYIWRYAEKCI